MPSRRRGAGGTATERSGQETETARRVGPHGLQLSKEKVATETTAVASRPTRLPNVALRPGIRRGRVCSTGRSPDMASRLRLGSVRLGCARAPPTTRITPCGGTRPTTAGGSGAARWATAPYLRLVKKSFQTFQTLPRKQHRGVLCSQCCTRLPNLTKEKLPNLPNLPKYALGFGGMEVGLGCEHGS